MRPDARREEILLEELGDELVIYDLQRHRVHQLNRTAALVWRCCDGHKTVAQLRKILQKEVSPAANDAIVYSALDRLGKAHLLRQAVTVPADAKVRPHCCLGTPGAGRHLHHRAEPGAGCAVRLAMHLVYL